ncbi:MAG: helix-turn-helix domain-containing protein [Bdellovibrionales bacterium]|nr:helix-turn-helix domain-containing protein [Bdellovibrionales bacterium]
MSKIKSYKTVRQFSTDALGLNDYESWLITFKNKLVKLIVETRKKNDLSQADLAKILGTTQSVVSRIESGHSKNITIDYLLKVISGLGISPNKMIKLAA